MLHEALSFLAQTCLKIEFWLILALAAPCLPLAANRQKWANRLRAGGLGLLLVLTFFPLGEWYLHAQEKSDTLRLDDLSDYSGLIVLGGSEDMKRSRAWAIPEYNQHAERIMVAGIIAARHPHLQIVLTGGGAWIDETETYSSEAAMSALVLADWGISPGRILAEERSRNTMENARFTFEAVQPKDEAWILVTSAFHMPRAERAFEMAGWTNITPLAVDHNSTPFPYGISPNLPGHLKTANLILKETLGSLAYELIYASE